MDYVIAPEAKTIWLGRQGENGARTLVFNVSDWIEAFGQGTAAIIVRRSGGDGLYPATVTADGGTVRWTIQAADVALPGYGVAELRYEVNDVLVKSRVYVTDTSGSLGDAGDVPDPVQSWVDEVLDAASEAAAARSAAQSASTEAAAAADTAVGAALGAAQSAQTAAASVSHYPYIDSATKHWMVWDTSAQAWADTGLVAEGQDGHGLIIMGLYATLAELEAAHPAAAVGDVYAVGTTAINVIYVWDGSSWVNLGSLAGPQGPIGPQGPNVINSGTTTTLTGVLMGVGGAVGVKSVDATPTSDSDNLITSGAVYNALSSAKPKVGTIALSGTWSGSGPFTKTVTVTGATVTANSKVDLQPAAAALNTLISAGVTALWVENNSGTLTAYALGAAPSAGGTVQCTVTEVRT